MNIRKIAMNSITPAGYNPRADLKVGDLEYEKLLRSIKEFGFVEPLVWNERTGNLVGGHQRYKILQAQGVTEIEVSVVDLPLEKEKALNIALNKVRGEWDENKLADLLRDLSRVPDFDCGLTGFDTDEINKIFDEQLKTDLSLDSDASDGLNSEGPTITQPGDLISLGDHRLLCGDSGSVEDLRKLLGDSKIRLVFTDPPYNCAYDSQKRPVQTASEAKWKPIANDSMDQAAYEAWLAGIMKGVTPFLDQGAPVYLWNGHRQFGPMHSILTGLGFHVSNVITWVKPYPTPGYGDYQMQSEFCIYAWLLAGGSHKWYGPPTETNIWESPRDNISELIHPSQKPVALAQRAIKNSSQRGNIVFDAFAGSGSTIIAAQSLERRCFAVEKEALYCDALTRRYIKTFGSGSVSAEVLDKYAPERQVAHG